MREEFVGYLLGALDPEEQRAVEQYLQEHPEAHRELEILRQGLAPLELDRGDLVPPLGLVERTCQLIGTRVPGVPPLAVSGSGASWYLRDWVMAASIVFVAGVLLFPALQHSRFQSYRVACGNNLRVLGAALSEYSQRYNGYFPHVASQGPLAAAGIYAPILYHTGFVRDPSVFVCPSGRVENPTPPPSIPQLLQASRERGQLVSWHRTMGGSYAYAFGYVDDDGRYYGNRGEGRSRFAVLADQPPRDLATSLSQRDCDDPRRMRSRNHGGHGQNVLYADGHVEWCQHCGVGIGGDHIFLNRDKQFRAGIGPDDSVLGFSEATPLPEDF